MSHYRRRIQFTGKDQVEVVTEEIPVLGPNEVLVQNEVSLISAGTELTCLHRSFAPGTHWDRWISYPHTPGYSCAGRVVSVGEEVREGIQLGDRVALRGSHASHVISNAENLFPLPDSLSSDEAAWIGLLKIVQVGIRSADIRMGERAVVIGCGILGQLAVQYLSLCGCETVIAVDTVPSRLEIAKRTGATHTLAARVDEVQEEVLSCCGGERPDVVFDVTGPAVVLPHCLSLARDFGRVILLGDSGNPDAQHISKDVILCGVQLRGGA